MATKGTWYRIGWDRKGTRWWLFSTLFRTKEEAEQYLRTYSRKGNYYSISKGPKGYELWKRKK